MPDCDTFLLYSDQSCETGEKLAYYLNVDDFGQSCEKRINTLIRWGSTRGVSYIPEQRTINKKSALEGNVDKLDAMDTLDEAGIPVPPFSTQPDDLQFPMLGRSINHTQGNDINLILQPRDIELTDNDFYVGYIPTHLEYRVHVVCGEIVKVHEKRLRSEEDNHPYIRNAETGWVFCDPREEEPDHDMARDAIDALDMDFGALDIIRADEDANYNIPSNYGGHNDLVLEVNSAPSLDRSNLQRYGDRLEEVIEQG